MKRVVLLILLIQTSILSSAQINEDSVLKNPIKYIGFLNSKDIENKNWLKAIGFVKIANHDSAIHFLEKSIKKFIVNNDTNLVIRGYTKLAWEYFQIGNYQLSIKNYQNGYDYIEKTNDCKNKMTLKHAEAIMHYYLKDYDGFLKKLKIVLPLAIDCNDTVLLQKVYSSISVHYLEDKQYDSALIYMNKRIDILKTIKDTLGLAHAYSILGDIYLQGYSNTEVARINYKKSEKLYLKSDDSQTPFCWNKLSNFYLLTNNLISAKTYNKKALNRYKELGLTDGILRSLNILAKINLKDGNIDSLYQNLQLYNRIQDTLYRKETSKHFAEMQTKYETEKKVSENLILKSENELKQAEIERKQAEQKQQLYIFIGLIFLVLLIVIFVFYKRKLAERERTQKLEKQRFKAVIEAEEKERVRIAKELHDGLGQILSTAKLNVAGLEGNVDKEDEVLVNNSMNLIDDAVKEVRNISHNMMPVALTNSGLIPALEQLISKMNDSGLLTVESSFINMDARLNSSTEIAVYRVIQEVLNNMIKHSKADKITVFLEKVSDRLNIKITDNGVGFDTNTIKESKGIGWKNIFSRVSLLNGNVDVDSSPGKGTNLLVSVPVS